MPLYVFGRDLLVYLLSRTKKKDFFGQNYKWPLTPVNSGRAGNQLTTTL